MSNNPGISSNMDGHPSRKSATKGDIDRILFHLQSLDLKVESLEYEIYKLQNPDPEDGM